MQQYDLVRTNLLLQSGTYYCIKYIILLKYLWCSVSVFAYT